MDIFALCNAWRPKERIAFLIAVVDFSRISMVQAVVVPAQAWRRSID
jgi:hypothetical protein